MDFERVLDDIISGFDKNKISYGLIGGYALGLYGVVRATMDLDFLIDKQHRIFLKQFMAERLYETSYESENVVQFRHPTGVYGCIDFLYAFRQPSLEMLKRAVYKKICEEKIILKVLIPEDIIGLKVQAFNNDAGRRISDLEDIKNLMAANADAIDWSIIEKHFVLFGMTELFGELKNEYARK